ncbi:MAG: two-component regulator propeller domain-containing protein [Caldilineaceae bacterium]
MITRIKHFTALIALALLLIWLLLVTLSPETTAKAAPALVAQANPLAQAQPTPTPTAPVARPCGRGEQMQPWVVCLYGVVTENGTVLDGALVEVTNSEGRVVSATTAITRSLERLPNYGIDLSQLDVDYLDTITVTARHNGKAVTRQLLVYPDFYTQNQRHDLMLPADSAPPSPAPLWGYVYLFGASHPVTDVQVSANLNGNLVTVTTAPHDALDPYPFFAFSSAELAKITPTVGGLLTLTASYQGSERKIHLTWNGTPQQANLLLGWQCDGDGVLPQEGGRYGVPQEGGRFGVPQEGGRFGVPDEACFWGYTLVDGNPVEGMQVQLTVNGEEYSTLSRRAAAEELPRYAIRVPGIDTLSQQTVSYIATFGGAVITSEVAMPAHFTGTQQINFNLQSLESLGRIVSGNDINALLWYDGFLWAGTTDGLIQWDTATGTYTWFREEDGLSGHWVTALAVDDKGTIHIGTSGQGVSRYNPKIKQWLSPLTSSNSGLDSNSVSAIINDGIGNMWYAAGQAVYRYTITSTNWSHFYLHSYSHIPTIMGTDKKGNLWVALDMDDQSGDFDIANGVSYFDSKTEEWTPFTSQNSGLTDNRVTAIAVTADKVWFGTLGGVNSYELGTDTWESYNNDNTNGGLISNAINSAAIDGNGRVWFGTHGLGVSVYDPMDPNGNSWRSYYTFTHQTLWVQAIAPADNGTVWFGNWQQGILGYSPSGTWKTLKTNSILSTPQINDIAVDMQGRVWFAGSFGNITLFDPSLNIWSYLPPPRSFGNNYNGGAVAIAAGYSGGEMWVSYFGDGVSRFRAGNWSHFNTVSSSLGSNYITAIAADPDGDVWFGTSSEGLIRYKENIWEKPIVASITGLLTNSISSLAIGFDNDLWIGTPNGINRYVPNAPEGQRWERFVNLDNGIRDDFINTIAVDAARRQVWFGIGNKFSVYRYSPDLPIDNRWSHFDIFAEDLIASPSGEIWLASGENVCRLDVELQLNEWDCLYHLENNPIIVSGSSIAIARDNVLWYGDSRGINHWQIPFDSDLQLRLEGYDSVIVGQRLTYTIFIRNIGKMAAENATLTVTLPTETIVRPLGTLNRGETTTITIPAILNGKAGDQAIITATVATTSAESFLENNLATWSTAIRSAQPDLRTVLVGPTSLTPNQPATFTVWVDNISGSGTTLQHLQVRVPDGFAQPNLGLDGVPIAFGQVISKSFVLNSPTALPPNSHLTFAAEVAAGSIEANVANNRTTVQIPTASSNIDTLFLVAGERMAQRSGHGASQVVNALYDLANKQLANGRQINGAVVDLQQASPAVAAAYRNWEAQPLSSAAANQVAQAIKKLLVDYAALYPNADTYVFVGGDDIIPFYRQSDESSLYWPEKRYFENSNARSNNTVRQSLKENYFLTDDFYTDFAPQAPNSILWKDANRRYYVPKKASSRLVETPAEIIAAIQAFIANNGELTLTPMLAGADPSLTADSAQLICQQVNQQTADACTLTSNPATFRNLLGESNKSIVNAQHSNHRSMGVVDASLLRDNLTNLEGKLLLSIGCHSGLNVPDPGNRQPLQANADYDLMQAVLGNGGVAIAPTAYAYATLFKQPSYSEEFLLQLIKQAQNHNGQTIGNLLMQSKAQFYTHRQRFLDSVDEKSAAAMTLYGLPMWRFKVSESSAAATVVTAPFVAPAEIVQSDDLSYSVHTFVFDAGAAFDQPIHTDDGDYYSYNDQIFVSDLRPVQPRHTIAITPLLPNGSIPHGVVLRQAEYHEIQRYDPVVAVAQAIGEEPVTPVEPDWNQPGWDWEEPYFLSNFDGRPDENPNSESIASINLVLGAFNNSTKVERLYTRLIFDIYYSNSQDKTPPTVTVNEVVNFSNATVVTVTATDNGTQPAQVVALCHDSATNRQTSVVLQPNAGQWVGVCPQPSTDVTIQVIDNAGNVGTTPPVQPVQDPSPHIFPSYLPIIMQRYEAPRPDLIVKEVTATPTHLAVLFQNVGTAAVASDFWIEVCVDPKPIPTQVNQICRGLSYQYAMWGYLASQSPILPGESRQVFVDLNGAASPAYQPTLSSFDKPLPVGTTVYAHVDAANRDSCYGGVFEVGETSQQPPDCPFVLYNNIQQAIVTATADLNNENQEVVETVASEAVAHPQLPPLPNDDEGQPNRVLLPLVAK